MREDAELGPDVADPNDIRVFVAHVDGLPIDRGELRLVLEFPVVAVGETLDVETNELAPIRHDVAALAFDRRGRTQSDELQDRKSTRLNSSHSQISYAVFCLKKKKKE